MNVKQRENAIAALKKSMASRGKRGRSKLKEQKEDIIKWIAEDKTQIESLGLLESRGIVVSRRWLSHWTNHGMSEPLPTKRNQTDGTNTLRNDRRKCRRRRPVVRAMKKELTETSSLQKPQAKHNKGASRKFHQYQVESEAPLRALPSSPNVKKLNF